MSQYEHADALWRAICYVAVAQIHLRENPLIRDGLDHRHVKDRCAGHWGTVPGTAWFLSHVGLITGSTPYEIIPVIGPGHAGVAQIALAWLTGDLATIRPELTADIQGLRALIKMFPDIEGLGSEVSPSLPAGSYVGGLLGGALAFSEGLALDTPERVVIPLIGDGECETPLTAASWLGSRSLKHGAVLPVIHVNGFKMGTASLLGSFSDGELQRFAQGLGWEAAIVSVQSNSPEAHEDFRIALRDGIAASVSGHRRAIFFRCAKGWSGPEWVEDLLILGTARSHKTPLPNPSTSVAQLHLLDSWLRSYHPGNLFDDSGRPRGTLKAAIAAVRYSKPNRPLIQLAADDGDADATRGGFAAAVTHVVTRHAAVGDFRLFSPDELESNRLGSLAGQPWVTELLAEEVLLAWLCGWTASGRRGVLVSYEAFAALLTAGLVAHLKHRRVDPNRESWPSVNLLLTSYGWHNVFTHGDPSLVTALLATGDPAVRVLTPADPRRLARSLDESLGSSGRLNVIIAGKHSSAAFQTETIEDELRAGLAIWQDLSDPSPPDLVVVVSGDLAAAVVAEAVPAIREVTGSTVRVVYVHDLTVLGDPGIWRHGLLARDIERYFGGTVPILIVSIGHPAAIWGLLAGRLRRAVDVIGWREPSSPMSQARLSSELRMTTEDVVRAAQELLARTP